MRNEFRRLPCKYKAGRRLIAPRIDGFERRCSVKGAINFRGVELGRIPAQPVRARNFLRVEAPPPAVIAPARSPDVDLPSVKLGSHIRLRISSQWQVPPWRCPSRVGSRLTLQSSSDFGSRLTTRQVEEVSLIGIRNSVTKQGATEHLASSASRSAKSRQDLY